MENQLTPMQTLKALVKMGIPFEQAYAQSWKDLRIRETQKTTINNGMTNNQAQAKANGAKGGRPKRVLALTDLATAVNNMLKRKMNTEEIAELLGRSNKSVAQIIVQYQLPRK